MEFKPLENNKRIEAIDALRGFALLGVLIANIPFAGEEVVTGKLDSLITFLWHFLIDKKFISIFSMLFGFGFYIQMKRAENRVTNFAVYFSYRMLLLFVIGSIHAFVIWNGDILRAYALGGIILLFVRNWPVKRLLFAALLFTVVLTSIFYIGNNAFGWQIYTYDYALAKELPVAQSYFRYFRINAIMDPWVNFTKDMPITLAFTFGNMLLGFILGKIDFFKLPQKLNNLTTILIIQGATLGLASSLIYYKIISKEIELNQSLFWVPLLVTAGMVAQSLMYVAIFIRLYSHTKIKSVLHIFKFTGRLSLSTYIVQSLFYLLVFYHCTKLFQLFGKLSQAETYLLAVLFFLLQSGLSYLWLRKNNQGPLESVWKRWSYRTTQAKENQENEIQLSSK